MRMVSDNLIWTIPQTIDTSHTDTINVSNYRIVLCLISLFTIYSYFATADVCRGS